ncbi:MAG: hypothetical protein R3F31_18060 [Verrucomicrobiales bacterium]
MTSHTLAIDWGDGSAQEIIDLGHPGGNVIFNPNTGQFSVTHFFGDDDPSGSSRDTYRVRVRVTDFFGATAVAEDTFTVFNVAPSLSVDAPTPVQIGSITLIKATFTDPDCETPMSSRLILETPGTGRERPSRCPRQTNCGQETDSTVPRMTLSLS